MIIHAKGLGSLSNQEQGAYISARQFPDFFTSTSYLAAPWGEIARLASEKKLVANEFFMDLLLSTQGSKSISVCCSKQILEYPDVIIALGVSRLFCSFWVGNQWADKLSSLGIDIYSYPAQPSFAIADQSSVDNSLLLIRAMGRRAESIELSQVALANAKYIEPSTGTFHFHEDKVVHKEIISKANLFESDFYQDSLSRASIVICRTPADVQYQVFWDAIANHTIPIVPDAPTYFEGNNAIIDSFVFPRPGDFNLKRVSHVNRLKDYQIDSLRKVEQLSFLYSGLTGAFVELLKDICQHSMPLSTDLQQLLLHDDGCDFPPSNKTVPTGLLSFISWVMVGDSKAREILLDPEGVVLLRKAYQSLEADKCRHIDSVLSHYHLAWLFKGAHE